VKLDKIMKMRMMKLIVVMKILTMNMLEVI